MTWQLERRRQIEGPNTEVGASLVVRLSGELDLLQLKPSARL